MAQHYDVSLKLLFRRSTGLVARALFGGRIREWVNVELPRVQNPRVDMVARMADGSLRHVELESRCTADMARREAEYYLGLYRLFNEHVEQVVLYVGNEPLRAAKRFRTPAMRFEYRLLDIRDFDGEPLLESEDLSDNMLALLTRTDREHVMRRVEERLLKLDGRDQAEAAQLFVLISGLRGLEEPVARRLSMIDVMENKVFRRVIRKSLREGREKGLAEGLQKGLEKGIEKGLEKGLEQGIEKGIEKGEATFFAKMLEAKFGVPLPAPVAARIVAAAPKELEQWLIRAVKAQRLEDVF